MTKEQISILEYTKLKVTELFEKNPQRAHGMGHISDVEGWAKIIAKKEKADEFICRMAALLHDVGRSVEELSDKDHRHHEFSYQICQKWFRDDGVFFQLSNEQKLELLYDVRMHWNNEADKYESAIILRDADKLAILGKKGIKRTVAFFKGDEVKILQGLRLTASFLYFLRTKTAKNIARKTKIEKPQIDFEKKLLKKRIPKIEL